MTSPAQRMRVVCPACGIAYDRCRPSINLDIDPWADEDYLREASTTTCPICENLSELGTSVVEARDGKEVRR